MNTSMWSFAIAVSFFAGVMIDHAATNVSPLPPPPPHADQGDIADLVKRLKPFVADPDSPYQYSNGLMIIFAADRSVEVKLTLKNGDKYSGTAATLNGAVQRVTNPSDDIRKALDGWKTR